MAESCGHCSVPHPRFLVQTCRRRVLGLLGEVLWLRRVLQRNQASPKHSQGQADPRAVQLSDDILRMTKEAAGSPSELVPP